MVVICVGRGVAAFVYAGWGVHICSAKSLMVQGRSGHGKRRGQDGEGLCPPCHVLALES